VSRNAYVHRIATHHADEAQANQSSSFKRNVRKAEKKDIAIRQKRDIPTLVNFYTLYCELRFGKFGSIPQPFSFFENIFDGLISKKNGFMLEAVFENQVIASIIVLQHKDVLFYKFGASSKDHLELRPNNLLFDALINHAVENEISAIDLGLSGAGESYKGLVRFKESMGGVATDLTYYEIKNGAENTENPEAKKWVQSLTKEIVAMQPEPEETSRLSKHIYPLFG
jgi:lipid II:glycine glycyltransferase (peptidoglycan interpeptide bridge formation enzyme)